MLHWYIERHLFGHTVKLLLSDHLRDHQKAVAEEKRSPNATIVHYIKQSDSIYYTLSTPYVKQILCCWYSFELSLRDDSTEYQQHRITVESR